MPSPILQDSFKKKLIKIRTFIIILGLIALSWLIALKLTQQRVQLEGLNSLNNIKTKITPFQWNFLDYDNELVESSKATWQYNSEIQSITAKTQTNLHLSLNFSSYVINSLLFDKLIINFKQRPNTKLLIQFKTELDDEYFYYSPHIKMTNKTMEIDLSELKWSGISDKGSQQKASQWGAQSQKVSSLVLNFTKSPNPIVIDSIALPFNRSTLKVKVIQSQVDCNGNIKHSLEFNSNSIHNLVLTDTCAMPSNYMWLKRKLHNRYPGSILTLENVKVAQKVTVHFINKSYTGIVYINVVFYGWLFVLVLVIWTMTRYSESLIRNQTIVTAKFNMKPTFNSYGFVLIPSGLIFLLLSYYQSASITTFKSLPFYFLWAVFQQFLLVYVLADKIFYKNVHNKLLASLLAALVFSSLHLPSVSLFILTFIAATFWSYGWLKHKKIIPLALSHSVLALMLYHVAPDYILYSAKVFQWFWE